METMQLAHRIDAPPVSYEDYLGWPETNLPCEFVDGRPIMTPSPAPRHQLAVSELSALLHAAVPADLKVLPSPLDWVLRRQPLVVRQPDLAVVAAEQARGDRLTAPPLLAVEIVSPTSRERDLVTKRAQYAEAGLAWYWLVDLDIPEVVVLRNAGGQFRQHAAATGGELLSVTEPFVVRLHPADLT